MGNSSSNDNNNNNNNNADKGKVEMSMEEAVVMMGKVQECGTVEQLREYVDAERLGIMFQCFAQWRGDEGKEGRRKVVELMKRLKRELHPTTTDEQCVDLLARYQEQDKKEACKRFVQRCDELMATEKGREYNRVFGRVDEWLAKMTAQDAGAGRSNRAKRARMAGDLFTKHAGLQRIEGAKVDSFGNAVDGDLGRDGAFDGLRIVILQYYSFDMGPPIEAMRQKGFIVKVYTATPPLEELREQLASASQLWIISGMSQSHLKEDALDLIEEAWRDGLGLYLFGDNLPYYVEANILLARLFGLDLQMSGNWAGQRIVEEFDGHHGFKPHLLTTGLVQLYEGHTVASIDAKVASTYGLDPILYEHEGHLVGAARLAKDGCGPIVIDGAFTKLYCNWDEKSAGSARFVRNCACFLSAIVDGEQQTRQEEQEDAPVVQLVWDGCLVGRCDITFEEAAPLALLARSCEDPDANTSDFALDNSFACGAQNKPLFGQQAFAFRVAQMMLARGEDPFRRTPVNSIIPCVSLQHPHNLTIVGDALCHVLMGGRHMPQKAWFLFLAVCDQHLREEEPIVVERREVWQFFESQIAQHVKSTPSFSDVGEPVPLVDAMAAFLGGAESLNKTFSHLAMMIRTLIRMGKAGPALEAYRVLLKRVAIKILVSSVLQKFKTTGFAEVKKLLDDHLYESALGVIPLANSAHAVKWTDLSLFIANVTPLLEEIHLMQRKIGTMRELLDDEEITTLLLMLRGLPEAKFQSTPGTLVTLLLQQPSMQSIWNDEPSPAPGTAVHKANEALVGSFSKAAEDHLATPPFVTCFGPSVFVCTCGVRFADPASVDLSQPQQLEELKQARNVHFRHVYNSDGNGYPTDRSAHFSLHRAVQIVLTREEFLKQLQRSHEMEVAVCQYLKSKSKGNVHAADVLETVRSCIDSYLALRAQGCQEPIGKTCIDFVEKAKMEQQLLLKKPQ